jgi:hypothetical protein
VCGPRPIHGDLFWGLLCYEPAEEGINFVAGSCGWGADAVSLCLCVVATCSVVVGSPVCLLCAPPRPPPMAPTFNVARLKVQLKLASNRLRMIQQKKAAQNAAYRQEISLLLGKRKLESARIRVRALRPVYAHRTTERETYTHPRAASLTRAGGRHRWSTSFGKTSTWRLLRLWSCTARCCWHALA